MTWINALPNWLGGAILTFFGIIISIAILYAMGLAVDRFFPDSGNYSDDEPQRCQDLHGSYEC